MFASAALIAQPQATLVLLNGNIHTMGPVGSALMRATRRGLARGKPPVVEVQVTPHANAVAVIGSRIVAVGGNEEIRRWVGPATLVVDLHGRLVVPGFNDAHVHFYQGGDALASVQLRSARSREEFRDRIAAFAAHLPPGRWVLNGAWDHENWSPVRLPTRQLIDAVTPGHPVWVWRLDGHMGLANSQALKLAGIDRNTPDPPGGAIVRDDHGEPTGVLKDAAIEMIARVIPPPTKDEIAVGGTSGHALCSRERRHQRAGNGHVSGRIALRPEAAGRRIHRLSEPPA